MKMIAIICSNPGPAVVSNNAGTWAGMIMLSLLIILFVCIGIRIKDDENE